MIARGIKIAWEHAFEYVPISGESCPRSGIIVTYECGCGDGSSKINVLNARCSMEELGDGRKRFKLRYTKQDNSMLCHEDPRWGTSIIDFDPSKNSGGARWCDDDDKTYNGGVEWTKVSVGLVDPNRRRVKKAAIDRQQERFRQALLQIDGGRCALTGETTKDALEAAHIIPASAGGMEVVENGILLRADLHRIMDRGGFRINHEGQVVDVSKALSDEYRALLSRGGLRLSKGILDRIGYALKLAHCGH